MKLKVLLSAVIGLGLFMSPVFTGASAKVQAGNGDMLANVLTNIETTNRKMTGLQATISHQRTNTQLGIKDVAQVGTLIYKPGAARRVRIDYTKPQTKIVSVNGDKAVLFERDLNQVFLSSINKMQSKNQSYGLLAVLNSAAQLKEKFTITLVGNETVNGRQATHLTLVPRTAEINYARIEVWVENQTWLPTRQIFVERNKDYTEVNFTNLVLNPKLSDKQFEVDYGKAKVVKG